MRFPKNVGEVDHNVRMFLAVPALIIAVESAIVYQARLVSGVAVFVGAAVYATGALRYSPLYHLLRVGTHQRASPHGG